MNTFTIPYTTEVLWALQQDIGKLDAEARLQIAMNLYNTGKLSTQLAAQIAGVPSINFLFLLRQDERKIADVSVA
ncbi:MAG: UPF0175 family protein [Ardenticatenaceae bacterium]